MENEKILTEKIEALMYHDESLAHSAFLFVVRYYQNKLYRGIQTWISDEEDAKDVLQEVWIKVWKNRQSFKGQSSFFSWLYRIAYNESMNYWRKKNKKPTVSLENHNIQINRTESNTVSSEEIGVWLAEAIQLLPEKQRIVFEYRYFDETSYEQISQLIGGSIGGLKANYFHAAQRVEDYLKFKLNQSHY